MDANSTNKKRKDQIFIKKMKDLGIEPEEYSKKWKFIGKLENENSRKIIRSKKYKFLEERLPDHTSTCFCGQKNLVNNYYIYCEDLDLILNVGSECVTKIGDTVTYKRCDICNEKHRNKNDNYCNTCRNNREQEENRIIQNAIRNRACKDCRTSINYGYDRCKRCYYRHKGWSYNVTNIQTTS